MASVSIPQPRELIPPLLACLPLAFVSPRPPPALLPLLSPVLRQRIQYATDATGRDGWLPLLSWDSYRASNLAAKVEELQIEPHPVSGELEIEDVFGIQYRRLDEETLHARFELDQFDLLPVYVWCENDAHGGGGAGWRLSELRALEDSEDGAEWFTTMQEANTAAAHHLPRGTNTGHATTYDTKATTNNDDNDNNADDDDDYWASYDRSPSRTPAAHSPAPRTFQPALGTQSSAQQADADDAYYSRYTSVQPAMDAHDPDEEAATGHVAEPPRPPLLTPPTSGPPHYHNQHSQLQRGLQDHTVDAPRAPTHAPRPISPASSTHSAKSVERLEAKASSSSAAEAGVRTFIGSEVRNLYRLARSVGLEAEEFEALVKRELEVVGMLEDA